VILPLLIAAVFFSVGFSSWLITSPTIPSMLSSGLFAENVYLSKEYVTAKTISISNYSTLHFVDSNGAASDTGSIVVSSTLNVDKCLERLNEKNLSYDNSLNVLLSLSYRNITDPSHKLFALINSNGYHSSITGVNLLVGQNKTQIASVINNGDSIILSFEINNLPDSGEYDFGVEFILNIPQNNSVDNTPSNFRNCFGKYIKNFANDKTQFVASVRVSETE
jgi:hypothetical protein